MLFEVCWFGGFLLRGKPWSIDEERLLRQLVEEGRGVDDISQAMGKTRTAIKGKLNNLGLNLKVVATGVQNAVATTTTTTTSKVPIADSGEVDSASGANPDLVEVVEADLKTKKPLPSIEEKLRELDAASRALHQRGLSLTEIKRLSKIIDASRVYNQLFEKYAKYRALEDDILGLRRQLASERSEK